MNENKKEFTKWLNESHKIDHGKDVSGTFIVVENKKMYFDSPTLTKWMEIKENEFNAMNLNS